MELQEGTLYIHSLIQQRFEDSCSVDQLLETNLNQSWHANMFCVVQSIDPHSISESTWRYIYLQ